MKSTCLYLKDCNFVVEKTLLSSFNAEPSLQFDHGCIFSCCIGWMTHRLSTHALWYVKSSQQSLILQNTKWHSCEMRRTFPALHLTLSLLLPSNLSPSPWSFWTFWWRRMNFHSAPPERKMRDIRHSIRAMTAVLWGWWDRTWGALARAWCCQVI